jgi:hypothetical protein
MSTYFGALIRSSGMRIGSADTARETPTAVADGLVEIHEERYAAAAERPWSAPAREEKRIPADRAAETSAAGGPATAASLPAGRRATASEAGSLPASPAPASRVDASSRVPAPTPAGSAAPPVPASLDPVRLALQWIAADPETRATAAVPSRSIAPPAPAHTHTPADAAAARVAVREIGVSAVDEVRAVAPVRQPSARTIAPPVESFAEAMPVTVHHTAYPDARPDSRRDDRGDAAEETLEISIGAINLHVEAPAPRTVVQPAPSPAASRQRTERSGLHRRYLRSF